MYSCYALKRAKSLIKEIAERQRKDKKALGDLARTDPKHESLKEVRTALITLVRDIGVEEAQVKETVLHFLTMDEVFEEDEFEIVNLVEEEEEDEEHLLQPEDIFGGSESELDSDE